MDSYYHHMTSKIKKIRKSGFFLLYACINISYMIKYIRQILKNRRESMLKENIKNYDLDELKIKMENLRREEI